MKMHCDSSMQAGALGVKIICKGRLGGAEMSRMETQKLGSIPLQSLRANVDYGYAQAFTTYGAIGVRVWLYKGDYRDLKAEELTTQAVTESSGEGRQRRGGMPGDAS